MHGFGVYTLSSGLRIEGCWVAGEAHGAGVGIYPDGTMQVHLLLSNALWAEC